MRCLGVIFIVIACSGVGFLVAGNYCKRPQQLRQLQTAFQMLETQICYSATPLPEALLYVAQRCNSSISLLFKRTGECLSSRQGVTAYVAWKQSLDDLYKQTALNHQDQEILLQFGMNLGKSDREEQIKHLQLLQTQLKAEEKNGNEERQKNERLWKYSGVLVGLLLVILLV